MSKTCENANGVEKNVSTRWKGVRKYGANIYQRALMFVFFRHYCKCTWTFVVQLFRTTPCRSMERCNFKSIVFNLGVSCRWAINFTVLIFYIWSKSGRVGPTSVKTLKIPVFRVFTEVSCHCRDSNIQIHSHSVTIVLYCHDQVMLLADKCKSYGTYYRDQLLYFYIPVPPIRVWCQT